jgi:N-carbamoyl-L-amino-acid hydrolase
VTFEEMWAELAPVGRSRSGGYQRLPFTAAEREAHAWFVEQCRRRDLVVETDAFGNTVAWWHPSAGPRVGVLTGSHLDSVADGGGYDGALGVVSALAAIDVLRDRGFTPARSLGVCVFAAEEGSRFPLPCLGSRLATGTTTWEEAAELRDRDGVALADVVEGGDTTAPFWRDADVFVELHVEQGRALVERDAAVGMASGIWPHGRYRFDFTGEPNHAGTTRMQDRRDPMLSYAMTVLAANKQARLADQRATFGRVEVHPNATNAIPARVSGWLDARATSTEELLELVADVERLAVDRAGRDGTDVVVTPESVTSPVWFDRELAGHLAGHLSGHLADHLQGRPGALDGDLPGRGPDAGLPVLGSAAGHDAGVLAGAGVRTAMLLVRNPTGVSHSPAESADPADCLAGVEALAASLALCAGQAP